MKTSLECIPCFVRQAVDAVKMSVSSDDERQRLMRNVLQWLRELDMHQSPPAISQIINRRVREILATDDPYRAAKDSHNALAAALIPAIRRRIRESFDPLTMALRYAITGNIIDLGAKNGVGCGDIYAELQSAHMQPLWGDMVAFDKAAASAQTILYLADNAGEIFFDRLLIEQLQGSKVTLAVRGAPVINDATRADALEAGLEGLVNIIDNGSDAPGTLLGDCSAEFRRRFDEADMIIAKGQGNFESLSGEPRNIFFLFRVKCPVVSLHSGFPAGTYVATDRFGQRNTSDRKGIQ
jgi:damage-control phosphatase, subfamily I